MNLREIKLILSNAPALLVYETTPEKASEKGTVLLYHGLKARKEVNRKELESIARRGYLAVGIDCAGHGERGHESLDERLSKASDIDRLLLEMVRETAGEIPQLIDALVNKDMALPGKIGICGISMGGYITYKGLQLDRRIKAAAPILGSPHWTHFTGESPHRHPDKFYPVALLSQNGGKDINVPPHFARALHEKLGEYYREQPERLRYVEFPDSGHFMLESDWYRLWDNTLAWFDNYLA